MNSLDASDVWSEIDQYFDFLEDAIDRVAVNLANFVSVTSAGSFMALEPLTVKLQTSLADLESLLNQRGSLLLKLADEQSRPKSLRQFLKKSGQFERLVRAEHLAERLEQQRQRAITVFTAHYWMYETTRDVLRLITNPGPNPGTYGMKVRSQGGGLLDEAA